MSIIGFSSGGTGRVSNVDRMVKSILENSGRPFEYVKLTDLTFSGCKGCAHLCAPAQVCRLEDEAGPYYQKIKDADAVVLGSPVYSGSVNGITFNFIERFYGYRHVGPALKDKPFILVVCGFRTVDPAVEQLQRRLMFQGVRVLETVKYVSGIPPCLTCGRHRECRIGGLYRSIGEAAHSLEIRPEHFRAWEDDPATAGAAEEATAKLKLL